MSKSIKFKNNMVIDENSINHNFGKLIYKNTTSNGFKWSYAQIKKSSSLIVGNKVKCEDNYLIVSNCKYVKINVKISFADSSYNFKNEIRIYVGSDIYEFKNSSNANDYIINNLIVPIKSNETKIYLTKYTDNENNRLITTEQDNYMSVEIIT